MSWPAQADKRRPGVYLLPAVSLLQLHENTTAPSTNNDGNINTGGKKAKKKRKKAKKTENGSAQPDSKPAYPSIDAWGIGRLTDASPSPSLFSLIGLRPRDAKQRRAPPPLRPLPKTAAALFTIPTGCLSRVSPTLSRVLVPVAAVYSSCTFRVIRSGFQCGNCVSVQDGSRGEGQQL